MPGRQISGSETGVEFDLGKSITLVDADSDSAPIEKVRTAVNVTKEAVHAISITALETLREGAVFMGVIGSRGELLNPFTHHAMKANYQGGNYGYGHAKQALFELILTKFEGPRERYNHFMANPQLIDEALKVGALKATKVADGVLQRVREKLGY